VPKWPPGLKPGVTLEHGGGRGEGRYAGAEPRCIAGEGWETLVFVDAGTVHAIWPGSVLLETQQNSDITYRLYDYGRPRELHVAKALEAIRLETDAGKVTPKESLADRTVLVDGAYFEVERVPVSDGVRWDESLRKPGETGGLTYLFAAEGSGVDPAA
jgi:mannose-6-phosphate isomerase